MELESDCFILKQKSLIKFSVIMLYESITINNLVNNAFHSNLN